MNKLQTNEDEKFVDHKGSRVTVDRGSSHLVILLQVEDVAVEEGGGVHLHPGQVGGGAELWLEEVGGVLLAAAAAAPPPGGHAHAGDVEEGDQHPGQHRHHHSETKQLVAVAYFQLETEG